MGVEFDFEINVTDCLAGFSLLNGLSLFVGCVVVPFLTLFYSFVYSSPPLSCLLCVLLDLGRLWGRVVWACGYGWARQIIAPPFNLFFFFNTDFFPFSLSL